MGFGVTLGERVRFAGFGLEGRITGAVDIEDLPDAVPRGRGELQVVQGEYSGYGSLQRHHPRPRSPSRERSRPRPFSDPRRIARTKTCLLCFTQAPPIGFKERWLGVSV